MEKTSEEKIKSGMRCSIIIPVYNNAKYTENCLADLSYLPDDYEIIIVDNASSDDTEEIIKHFNVKYIKNKTNLGFSKANNIGQAASGGDYILFLNNDIKVTSDYDIWPEKLINACGNGIVGVQAGQLDKNYNFVKEGFFDPLSKGAYLSGWCLMASRQTWDKLIIPGQEGSWNAKDYFLYFEDGDLSFRAKQNGISLKIVGNVPISHYARVTGKKYNMFHYYHKSKKIFKKNWTNLL